MFGGQNNLHEGLENACALYKPKMIAVFTSCMPEIIGDDLTAFIKNARQRGSSPRTCPCPLRQHPQLQRLAHPRLRRHAAVHPADPDRGEAGGGALHRQAEPHRRLRRQHRQLPRVQADPRSLRHPLHPAGRHLRHLRLALRRHLPALPRRHAAGRRRRLHQRQGHPHRRPLRHRQDLRLDQGQLRRQPRLPAHAHGDRQDRRLPHEDLRALRQAGPGRRSRPSAAGPSTP